MEATFGRRMRGVLACLAIGAVTFFLAVLVQSQFVGDVIPPGPALRPARAGIDRLPWAFVVPVALAISCLAAVGSWAVQVARSKR